MNRRNFLKSLSLAVGAGFSILPGAGRIWSARANPAGIDTDYRCVMEPPKEQHILISQRLLYLRNPDTGKWHQTQPVTIDGLLQLEVMQDATEFPDKVVVEFDIARFDPA